MSTPIQAQSISSLNDLLANPPRYPRNPTHTVHDSLVLYIVRVPGSKDVFLTPLKPPTKASISIEAVQSSLYFLHVERPEDEELRKSLEVTKIAETRKEISSPIQRKPLPTTPYSNYPASNRPPTPPKSYPNYQPTPAGSQDATQVDRYANRGTNLRLSLPDPSKANQISRKPIGARPMPGSAYSQSPSSPADSENTSPASPVWNSQNRIDRSGKPVLKPSTLHDGDGSYLNPPSGSPLRSSLDTRYSDLPLDAFRITLIRRDPASGNQWNVGSITLSGTPSRDTALRHFDIELTSPGYGRFAQNEGGVSQPFNRKTGYMLVPNSEPSPGLKRRSDSVELFSSAASAASRKPRQAYSFLSPWKGLCSFNNGIDGRSLRCRHMLPAASPSMPSIAADVAELRFNLPWAKLRPRDLNKEENSTPYYPPASPPVRPQVISGKDHQWRRSLQNFTHKARAQLAKSDNNMGTETSVVDTSRRGSADSRASGMDLNLGREKAGGGFKGHSAKLGKLIIDDEGLKMCDLVVAACMGVWWQHYSGDVSG